MDKDLKEPERVPSCGFSCYTAHLFSECLWFCKLSENFSGPMQFSKRRQARVRPEKRYFSKISGTQTRKKNCFCIITTMKHDPLGWHVVLPCQLHSFMSAGQGNSDSAPLSPATFRNTQSNHKTCSLFYLKAV